MDNVVIESSFVNSLFKCSLCNDLIHSATVINECLHRFCKSCITNYFQNNNNNCPTCQMILVNPLQTLKSDLTFQRLLYKIFQRKIACKSSLLSSTTANVIESTHIQIETKINVYVEYWDISLDLFPNGTPTLLSKCYLQCTAGTPLTSIETFIRMKHSIQPTFKIDLFYQTFLLNTKNERLIDICYSFDILNKNQSLDIRFTVSPYGYKAILKRIRQSKRPVSPTIESFEQVPLQIEVPEKESTPAVNSSLSSTSSIDSTLKVKLCRSQSSTNDWFISQSTPSVELPDLINSCDSIKKVPKRKQPSTDKSSKKKLCTTSKYLNKPRRRTRFIPTMVKVPPSIFDRLSTDRYDFNTFQQNEMVITNVEGTVTDTSEVKQTLPICKVPPYIPEKRSPSPPPPEKPLLIIKPTPIYPLLNANNIGPLDLSLK